MIPNILQTQIESLPEDHPVSRIEETASRLEGLQYAPPISVPMAKFLRFGKMQLLQEIETIFDMSSENDESEMKNFAAGEPLQDQKQQNASVLIYYYKKLTALRNNDPGEWDEIDELYVHD